MNNKTPCIIIPGFCQSKLNITDEDGNILKKVWPASFDTKSAAKRVLSAFVKTVITRKDRGFTDAINDIFYSTLEPTSRKPDGTPKYHIETVENTASLKNSAESLCRFTHKIAPIDALSEEIGDENIYLFSYDFFSDPFTVAEKLDRFIDFVISDSGSDKVNLLPYSLGGPVTLAYLELFAHKNTVKRMLYLVPAFNGSSLIADVMEKNVDKRQGYSILEFVFSKDVADTFRKVLFFTPWEVRYQLLYKSLDSAIELVLRNSALMWSLVPCERYEALSSLLIGDKEHEKLKEITDKYHTIQERRNDILLSAKENGTDIFICAGYGERFIEMSLDGETSTDRILSLESASLGAYAKLGDERPSLKNALFPENTWVVKGLSHVTAARNKDVQALAKTLLSSSEPDMALIE